MLQVEFSGRHYVPILYLMLAAPLVVQLSWLIPPFQSPDEMDHIKKAYIVSTGNFGIQTLEGKGSGGCVDRGLLEYINLFEGPPYRPNVKISREIMAKSYEIRWSGSCTYVPFPGASYYSPVIYIPQATAMKVSQVLDFSLHTSYQLVRAVTSCIALLLCALALYLMREGREFVIATLLLPMSLSQMSTSVIDGEIFGMVACVLGLFAIGVNKSSLWRARHDWFAWILIATLATVRPSFIALAGLFFWVSWCRKSVSSLPPMLVAIVSIIAWNFYALSGHDNGVTSSSGIQEKLLLVSQHPSAFVSPLFETLSDKETLDFYYKSFIGVLGWLDTPLQNYLYWLGGAFLLITGAFSSTNKAQLDLRDKLVLFATFVMSTLLIFLLLWASATPNGSMRIQGVQGRYFIPMLMGAGVLLSGVNLCPPRWKYMFWFFAFGWVLLLQGSFARLLVFRYWLA